MDASLVVSIAALIMSGIGVVLSYIVAKKYGDLAAVEATRKLHEEDARRARLTALRSLLNEVERIEKVVDHNRQLQAKTLSPVRSIIRMPVVAFETAFVSGKPGLNTSEELIQVITDYLICADSINSLIDAYPASLSSAGTRHFGDVSTHAEHYCHAIVKRIVEISGEKLPPILVKLKDCLQEEIEWAA